ncbi:MAG TPA: aminotransferase class IV [Pirellulales bacterium]|jgi:branched-subunit amino acid aminotransferase/4-amino-4-deoxychorismate lyase|nr:aminotransferase class IV [Pirellulales bacterium]
MSEPLAYLNGSFVPASQAVVPVWDTGFVLGATVAEQLRTFGGKLFALDAHLERLRRSLQIVGVDPGLTSAQLAETAEKLVAANYSLLPPGSDLGLAIFVTPGSYGATAPAAAIDRPSVGLHTYPLPFERWARKYTDGERLVVSDIEQVSERCWPAELKCRSRMHYYLADRLADKQSPGSRALLLDRHGNIAETAAANIVVYRSGDGLLTPRREMVLPGISLAKIETLAHRLGVPFRECDLSLVDLGSAEELMLTSTPYCVLAVTSVDGQPVGDGRPGPVFRRLLEAWNIDAGLDIVAQALQFQQSG